MNKKKKTHRLFAAGLCACLLAFGTAAPAAAADFAFEPVEGFGGTLGADILVPGKTDFDCPDLTYYHKVIFVGDSRTEHTSQYVNDEDIFFVAKSGMGLSWFKNTGYHQLSNILETSDFTTPLRSAIVFNLGINDLWNQKKYIDYMNLIAPELANQNCDLYYMSLNPVDNTMTPNIRPEKDIRAFNNALKNELDDRFTYLNSYSYLMDTGFMTNDGLHYSSLTYYKIFKFVIDRLNEKKPSTTSMVWKQNGLYWYAVHPATGAKYTNRWVSYEKAKYYVDANGRMAKNRFITSAGKRYYVGASGRMYTSQWLKTGGKYYYLQENGVMAVNTVIDGYPVGSDGVWNGETLK